MAVFVKFLIDCYNIYLQYKTAFNSLLRYFASIGFSGTHVTNLAPGLRTKNRFMLPLTLPT